MKRLVPVLCISLLAILPVSCSKSSPSAHDEDAVQSGKPPASMARESPPAEGQPEETYQTHDPMASDYREGRGDGYSWRYREIAYDKNDRSVSKEKLLSTRWTMDPTVNQFALLVFYSDDVFKIGTFQASVSIQGKYRIEGAKVYLSDYNLDEWMNGYVPMDGSEIECGLNFDSDNVEYGHELIINGTKFFPEGSEKNGGDKARLQGLDVIVDKTIFVFNDTVRFRTGPSLDADLIEIYLYNELSYGETSTSSFKKGTVVYALARTTHEEEIDGRQAPWYYIAVSTGHEGYQYGWVFGAYFDEYQAEHDDIYWQTLHRELAPAQEPQEEQLSRAQLPRLAANKQLAESLYRLQGEILTNIDRTEEGENDSIYYSKGNHSYITIVTFTNNEYLDGSPLKIGMTVAQLEEILGSPTSESENKMEYNTFLPGDGAGYILTFEILDEEIHQIQCYFEK